MFLPKYLHTFTGKFTGILLDIDDKILFQDIIPLNSGGSYKLLFDMFYHIRQLKYVRQSHLKQINPRYSKICAINKLNKLVEKEFLENTYDDVYIATDKVLPKIKKNGYNIKLLPKESKGKGEINQLNNTEVFIQALNLPDYKTLLYPNFDYIEPDALLVRIKDNAYKLEFLEIEASKSNWPEWLENKRTNYLKLANDPQVYSYWKAHCTYLKLEAPDIKDFKFSVSIIGKIKKDFETGFNFIDNLNG